MWVSAQPTIGKHSSGWQEKDECQKYHKNYKKRWMSVNTMTKYTLKKVMGKDEFHNYHENNKQGWMCVNTMIKCKREEDLEPGEIKEGP